MLIEAFKIIGKEALKAIVNKTADAIEKNFSVQSNNLENFKKKFPELYESHYNELCKWAFSIPFIGLNKPKETSLSTIELSITTDLVKKISETKTITISENDVLSFEENILIVGAPGAGKTTTIKRLIINYLFNVAGHEKSGFPILVRLRNIPPHSSLSKYILTIFGINYHEKEIQNEKIIIVEDERGKKTKKKTIVITIETYVDETPIEIFMEKFLNHTQSLLLLDGLDEIDKSIQEQVFREIERIGLKLTNSKIILTVRASELNKMINGFSYYYIAPLSQNQIADIAGKWLKNGSEFIADLNSQPYSTLANRPIFLTLLMILYDKYNSLPSQPSEIYDDATYLIIKECDEHQDIPRLSKYRDFTPRKKLKFLTEVAYYLTYKTNKPVFDSRELEKIYDQIHKKYQLPKDDMKAVIAEIESYTGIIMETGYKTFEFSHLSIQEFLCAKYLVNLPSRDATELFSHSPEVLALAVCISSEPSLWLSNLLVSIGKDRDRYWQSIFSFVSRLLIEKPSFKKMNELGLAFFILASGYQENEGYQKLLDEFYDYSYVQESFAMSINQTKFHETHKQSYFITLNLNFKAEIPERFVKGLIKRKLIVLEAGMISTTKLYD